MKLIVSFAFAVTLAAASAQAAQATKSKREAPHHHSHHHVYDKCHGMSSGTAHKSCGSRTGGPSGGLH